MQGLIIIIIIILLFIHFPFFYQHKTCSSHHYPIISFSLFVGMKR